MGRDSLMAEELEDRAGRTISGAEDEGLNRSVSNPDKSLVFALRAGEDRFRILADSLPVFVWTTDPDGRATYFNRQFYEYTGISVEDSLGFGFARVFHPDDRDSSLQKWQKAWLEGARYDLEYRLRRRDGQYRWFLGRGEPVRDPATGKVTMWAGTCSDITEQHEARALYRSAARVLDTVNDAYVTLDRDFKITFANRAAAVINVKSAEEFVGKTTWEEWPATIGTEIERQYRKAMATREPVTFVHHYFEANEHDVWLDISVYPAAEEDGGGLHIVYHDISNNIKRQQRDQLLAGLSERSLSISDPTSLIRDAVTSLGQFLRVSRCTFGDIDIQTDLCLIKENYCDNGVESMTGEWSLSTFGEHMATEFKEGRPVVVNNTLSDGETELADVSSNYQDVGILAHVTVPLVHSSQLVSTLAVHSAVPRSWTAEEIDLIKIVLERTWFKVEVVRQQRALESELELRRENDRRNALFNAMIHNSTDFIAYVAMDMQSIFLNEAGRRLIGLDVDKESDETIRSMGFEQFFYRDDVGFIREELFPQVFATGNGRCDVRFRHTVTGDPIWVNCSLFTVSDPDTGEPTALMTITRDIRQQRLAEDLLREQREYLNRLLESSPDSIMTLDLDGRILSMNDGSQDILQVDGNGNISERNWLSIWTDEVGKLTAESALEEARSGGHAQFEGRSPTFKGELRWWDALIVPLLGVDNKPEQLLAVLRDITERHRLYAEEHARADRDAVLAQIGGAIRQSLPPMEVQAVAVDALGKVLASDRCYIVTLDRANDEVVVARDYCANDIPSIECTSKLSTLDLDFSLLFPDHQTSVIFDIHDSSAYGLTDEMIAILNTIRIRSAVSVPFYSQAGQLVAFLVVAMANNVRRWLPEEILFVEHVATETKEAVEAAQAQQRERNIARQLQDALLPPAPKNVDGLELASFYRPALDEAAVGGDGFDVFDVATQCTALCVFDLSGKGLNAASQVATVRNMTRFALYNARTLVNAVSLLNKTLAEFDLLEGFATLFLCAYDLADQSLTYVNCGQEPALLWRCADDSVERLMPTGQALGAFAEGQFTERRLELYQGDVLAIFTDGLTEVGPNRRDLLEIDGLEEIFRASVHQALLENSDLHPSSRGEYASKIIQIVIDRIERYAGGEASLRDDIALLVCAVTNSNASPVNQVVVGAQRGKSANRWPRPLPTLEQQYHALVADSITNGPRVEAGIRDSEARFRALADNIAQLAWIADPTGYRTWFNQRWLQYTGMTLEESLGWGWRTAHHPDYVEDVSARFAETIRLGAPWEDTFPIRGKDGSYRWFLSRAFPTRDESGAILLWCGTNTDVTEEREAREALRQAEATLRSTTVQQRKFVKEILASVTEGKLSLCYDAKDLPKPLKPMSDVIKLAKDTPGLLRRRAMDVANEIGMSSERIQDLVTAVGEAAMNAINHGGGGTGRVYVDLENRSVQVWIVDHGKGIREEDLPRATLEKGWSGSGSLGHGFFLMLNTVDRTYLLTSEKGTTIVIEQNAVGAISNLINP